MKFLSLIFAFALSLSSLAAQCELKVQIDANPTLKICAGSFYTLRPIANAEASFVWFKDGRQVVLPYTGQFVVSEPGVYKVEASSLVDPLCKAVSAEVVVSTIEVPKIEVLAKQNSFCQGDSVAVQSKVESSTNWAFQWFKNDLPITNAIGANTTIVSGGAYSVKIQQEECAVYSNVVVIKELPKPIADFEFSATNQNGINFTNLSEGGVSFAWSFGDGKVSELVNPSHVFGASGKYKIELIATAKNGCFDVISKSLSVGTTSTSTLTSSETELMIYPNPTEGVVNFRSEVDLTGAMVNIFDLQGKILGSQQVREGGFVDLSGYASGTYLLNFRNSSLQFTRKVTKL